MLYKQINQNERYLIDYLRNVQKFSVSKIASELKRYKSTISREIKRNSTSYDYYWNEFAHNKFKNRQWHKHSMYLNKYHEFTKLFKQYYDKRHHGVEATVHLIRTKFPNVCSPSSRQVFYWIKSFRWVINRRHRLRWKYIQGGKRKAGIFSKIKNKLMIPIWMRPPWINFRKEYGHYEMDLIMGKNGKYHLLNLTERVTRMTYFIKVINKNPWIVNTMAHKLITHNKLDIKSITIDNGYEFQKVHNLARKLNCKIYYCQPYAYIKEGQTNMLMDWLGDDDLNKPILGKLQMNKLYQCKMLLIICLEKCLTGNQVRISSIKFNCNFENLMHIYIYI